MNLDMSEFDIKLLKIFFKIETGGNKIYKSVSIFP